MSYQLIILKGNLTRDAEIRQIQGQDGTPTVIAKVDIAVGESYVRRDGVQVNNVEYFNNIEIWNKPGINPYLLKGQSLLVQCIQKTETYTGNDGQQHKAVKYRAQVVELCGERRQEQQQPPMQQPPMQPQYQAPPQYQQQPMPPAQPPMPPQQQYQAPPIQPQYQQQPAMPPQQEQHQQQSGDLPFL